MGFTFLFGAAILLLPFNDLPFLYWLLGEMGFEAAFTPLFLMVAAFLLATKGSFYVPRLRSFTYLMLFLVTIILSGAVNSFAILQAQFAGRSGVAKYFLQLLVFLFGVSLAVGVFNLAQRNLLSLATFRRFLTLSFLVAGLYCVAEVFLNLGSSWAEHLFTLINPLFHTEDQGIIVYGQIRSVTAEPSYFGMYAALLLPWLVSYLFTDEQPLRYGLLVLYLIFLIFLSSSRLGYGLLLLEFCLLCYLARRAGLISLSRTAMALVLLGTTALAGYLSVNLIAREENTLIQVGLISSLTSGENLSNICRYGTQVAAFHMGLDHPLLGTGLGQFPFYMEKYLPAWSMLSPEILGYLRGQGLPRVHGMYARILSEMGFSGLLLWVAFLGRLTLETWRAVRPTLPHRPDWLGLSLVVNLVALGAMGFAAGSFRSPAMWLIFGLAWSYCLSPPESGADATSA